MLISCCLGSICFLLALICKDGLFKKVWGTAKIPADYQTG